jgi:uncharacterized protein YcfL
MRTQLITLLALILMLVSCHSTKTTTQTDTQQAQTTIVYRDRVTERTDSVYLHDSVFIKQQDSIVYEYHYRDRYRDRIVLQHDTLLVADTITLREQKTITISQRLTAWQKIKIGLTGALLLIAAIGIAYVVRWIIKKYRK